MSSLRTLAASLEEALEDLKEQDFLKFCGRLLDRRTTPTVRRYRVEGKSRLEVTDVMVSTFTEQEAVRVAVEILTSMGLNREAQSLESEVAEIHSATGPARDQHFVKKKRLELINRVRNMGPILDELLHQDLIGEECYNRILSLAPREAQMRELLSHLMMTGPKSNDAFYKILQKHEKWLIDDLNHME